MTNRVNYMSLLKESVLDPKTSDHDTSKAVDVKGPFLDPILGYDGGGELPTHKDAASILERYYFKNNADVGVRTTTNEDAAIPQVGGDKGALDDEPETVEKSKKDIEDAVMMEESDDVENAVIERLIAEMEEDGDVLEEIGGPEPDKDPAAKNHEPSGDPDKKADSLITGDAHDKAPPAASIKEDTDADMELFDILESDDFLIEEEDIVPGDEETPKEDEDDKEEKDLDVDKELKESGAPVGQPSTGDDQDPDPLDEAFDIFSEAFLEEADDSDDDVPSLDEDNIIV